MQCDKLDEIIFSGGPKTLEYEFYIDNDGVQEFYDPDELTINLLDKFDNIIQSFSKDDTQRAALGIYKFTLSIPRYTTNEKMFLEVVDIYNDEETLHPRYEFDVVYSIEI